MRAVIIAAGDLPAIAPLNERYPVPMLPLVDRPFIQHLVEFLVSEGVTRFDFILSHLPEKIEEHLGDGQRWGSKFTYHLARDPFRPYRLLKTMSFDAGESEPILLGHADRLPLVKLRGARFPAPLPAPIPYCTRTPAGQNSEDPWQWTGWAMLAPPHLDNLPGDADESQLRDHLLKKSGGDDSCRIEVTEPLCMRTFGDILASNQAVLDKKFPVLVPGGVETDPGVWLSRNVMLHPTARIVPPVYIGENCQVGSGVQLGPHAVVGLGCLLDSHCAVTNSVIFPGSYVGEGLELAEVIVDKNRLINARFGGALTISDNFILGSLAENQVRRWLMRQFARVVALVLLIAIFPVLLITALILKVVRTGPVLHKTEVVRLPAPMEDTGWETFALWSFTADVKKGGRANRVIRPVLGDWLLRFLPGLVNIVKGDLGFAGVPSRAREEIAALSHDWRSLYLHAKAGVVTEASIRCGPNPTEDELYAAEGFYAVAAGWAHDLGLLCRYFGRTIVNLVRWKKA